MWEAHLNRLKSKSAKKYEFCKASESSCGTWMCFVLVLKWHTGIQSHRIWEHIHLVRQFVRRSFIFAMSQALGTPLPLNEFTDHSGTWANSYWHNELMHIDSHSFAYMPIRKHAALTWRTNIKEATNSRGARGEPQGEGQSETNVMGRAKCELKHWQHTEQQGSRVGDGGCIEH